MKITALAAVLAALAACAHPKTTVEYSANMDLGGYHRIAVLPFTDTKGRGRQIAAAVIKGLPARGFEAPDAKLIESVFSKFKLDKEVGLGINELSEIRSTTKSQAILVGNVEPGETRVTVLLLDTDLGDEIFKATLVPRHKGSFASVAEISDEALTLFGELPKRQL
jgi:hypothetical protein